MKLKKEVRASIEKSVLCWLATISADNSPNVSPKEVFTYWRDDHLIIANIASPQSAKNIKQNSSVCVSFIDVFVQKGYKINGQAQVLYADADLYHEMRASLLEITQGKYPFQSIICIRVEKISPIMAPSYFLYPEISEQDRIASAKKTYGV